MYKIGSFNCHNMGGKTTQYKIEKIAQIINGEDFDIIALQEVFCSKFGGLVTVRDKIYPLSDILKLLKRKKGSKNWIAYFAAPKQSRTAEEGYVFIWNPNRVHLPKTKLKDGTYRVFYPRIVEQDRRYRTSIEHGLVRSPLYARFIPNTQPKMEFRIINTHIRFSKTAGITSDTHNEVSEGDIEMRRNEYRVLTRNIYPKIEKDVYGAKDGGGVGSFYTIMIGDYNLNLDRGNTKGKPHILNRSEKALKENRKIKDEVFNEYWTIDEDKGMVTFQESLTTLRRISENEDESSYKESAKYSNNFDHSTMRIERFKGKGLKIVTKTVDAVRDYNDGKFYDYRKNISDHIPICVEFDNRSDD